MKEYKHSKSGNRKSVVLIASFICLFLMAAGGTLAWLAASTGDVVNTFTPAKVEINTEEDLTNVKSNVHFTNKGDVPVYIRVDLVVTWKDGNGNIIAKPADATMTGLPTKEAAPENWIMGADGFWYYTEAVQPKSDTEDGITENLIGTAQATFPEGSNYTVDLEVMVQSVQAEPSTAVTELWGETAAGYVGAGQ